MKITQARQAARVALSVSAGGVSYDDTGGDFGGGTITVAEVIALIAAGTAPNTFYLRRQGGGSDTQDLGTIGASVTADLANASVFLGELDQDATINVTGFLPAGRRSEFAFAIAEDGTGGWTPDFPQFTWIGGTPTWDTTPGTVTDVVAFSDDGGTNVRAAIVGGGSGLTVEDEGTPLATAAATLDFVGAGVTASGTGATKTITIPGGFAGGGSAIVYPPLKPGSPTDDFTTTLTGWTAHSSAGSFAIGHCFGQGVDGSRLVMTYGAGQNGQIYQSTTNADHELIVGGFKVSGKGASTVYRPGMVGIAILNSSGTGVGVLIHNDGLTYLAEITAWAYVNYYAYATVPAGSNLQPDDEWWLRLVRVTNTWTGFLSFNGRTWDIPLTGGAASGSKTITADRIAIGTFLGNFDSGRIECDWIDVV